MLTSRWNYWKPRFVVMLLLAGLMLIFSANLPISPLEADTYNLPPAAPSTFAPVTTGAGTWLWQNPLPQGNFFTGIQCPSASICYAAGAAGTILKTIDGGASWTSLPTGAFASFIDLSCPTTVDCFAINIGGNISVTADGGASWISSKKLSFVTNSISCPNPTTCFVVGSLNKGYIAATSDGGDTWTTQVNDLLDFFFKVTCLDVNTCYAAGNGGIIAGTKDGGKNWVQQSYRTVPSYQYISCPDNNTCYASATNYFSKQSYLAKTVDGGQTWSSLSFGTTGNNGNINCPDPLVCYAVDSYYLSNGGIAGNSDGRLIKTVDGGVTWTPQFSIPDSSLGFISCTDTANCIAVGAYGTILTVTNGGTNWTRRSSGPVNDLEGISCPSNSECVSVGLGGTILTTNDMGVSWISQTSGITRALTEVSCTSPANCVVVGSSGTILTGGPAVWISRTSGTAVDLTAISCPVAGDCYAVGVAGTILYSNDNGISWNSQNSSTTRNLNAISCVPDTNICFAVGDNNTILTNSSGKWTSQHFSYPGLTYYLRAISCPDASNCFAVADSGRYQADDKLFVITTDGGANWNWQVAPAKFPLYSISCINKKICYTASLTGFIYATFDGGKSWNPEISGTLNDLYSLSCHSISGCTVVGQGGAILTNQLIVTKGQDSGNVNDFGSFSYALDKSVAGQNIGFSVSGGVISPTTSLNVKPGVTLYAACSNPVTLDFQNNAAISLNLSGQNTLQGIKIVHAAGTAIKVKGNGNLLRCSKVQR